ncbi:Kunitz family trypsin and protease inhibitor protein [Abeliophyllum distichum]|uniref:Kunitz family trypsin and protease inhibitor protein n=1 Tax=Abeliophyllum distichum TaxID=126358 RepID=A0ABD1U104_9LAMI
MKVTKSVTLFHILLSFSSLTTSSPVVDTDGNEVQSNIKYNVLPLERGNGGGLSLSVRDRQCPLNVVQENNEAAIGLPLKLYPLDNKQQVINLSTDLNIVFKVATTCVQSTAWRLDSVNEITGRRYISTRGIVGSPGLHTVDNWFKIEKYGNGNGYKIVWCPTNVCKSCKLVCGNVGVFVENDQRWLGLSDVPLVIGFKKSLD